MSVALSCAMYPAAGEVVTVLDPLTRPMSGVLIQRLVPNRLLLPPNEDQYTTISVTGKDGKFIADSTTSKTFILLSKAGYATIALDASKPLDSSVTMEEAGTLAGTLLSDGGLPIPNALIGPVHHFIPVADPKLEPPPVSDASAPIWTRTDTMGRFHLSNVSKNLQGFVLQSIGYTPHFAARPAGSDTTITLSSSGTTWTGVLLGSRDNRPQLGIYVEAVRGPVRVYAITKAEGEFTFPQLDGDDWQFRTAAAPTGIPKNALLQKRKRSTRGNEIVLLCNQGVVLAGEVRDARTNALVRGVGLQLDAFQGEDPLTTSTDANGGFRFEGADAFRSLTLRFDDYVCRTPQNTYWSEVPIDTMKANDQTSLTFAVLARVNLTGRVIGPGDRPVPKADVYFKLRSTGETGFGDFIGRVRYQVKSGPRGEFESTVFPPGKYEIEGCTPALGCAKFLQDATTSSEMLIRLQPLMQLRGRTLDAEGGALPDCRVDMSVAGDVAATSGVPTSRLIDSIRSDAAGQFEFNGVFPRLVALDATHPSSDEHITTEVASNAKSLSGPLELRFSGGELFSASVIDETGQPVADAIVQVYSDRSRDSETSEARLLARRTNEEGRAAFGLQARKLQKIIVRKSDYLTYTAGPIALPNSNYIVRLKSAPSIAVTVTGQAAAAEQMRQIWLLRAEEESPDDPVSAFFQSVRREESSNGEALFKNLRPGWYKVSTSNGSIYGESKAVELEENSGVVKVELTLAQGATLAGRIIDEDTHDPVKGAQVHVQLPCCTPQGFDADPVMTDADGKYEFVGLPAGAMVLTVRHPSYSDRAQYVHVPQSGTRSLEVKLGHGTSVLSGQVTLDGKPLPNAAVYLYRAQNRNEYSESAVTGEDGKYVMQGVPEGNHVLQVQALYGTDQVDLRRSQEVRIKSRSAKVDIDFHGLVHVTGQLRTDPVDESPNPRNMLYFSRRSRGEDLGQSYQEVRVNPEGVFEIYLEPGPYTIGLQEGSGMALEVPEASREFSVLLEMRELAEASGIKIIRPGDPVEPRDVPDKEGL